MYIISAIFLPPEYFLGMDVQPPTKSTERWQGKTQYMAEETLEDKIDLWFKVNVQ